MDLLVSHPRRYYGSAKQEVARLLEVLGVDRADVVGILGVDVAAGAWQWSPLKASCVAHCRSPLGFMMNERRDGLAGAFGMGLRYAAWCLGCCWLVMAVLFVAGAMSFAWALAISAYVLAERVLPLGRAFDRAVGAALATWGAWLLVAALR